MVQVIENINIQNGCSLDKIAQLPTDTRKNLTKRARSKFYTQKIVYPLLFIDSPLNKGYVRAFLCGSVIKQHGKKLTSNYCNSRICHVCNRIRTAKMMSGYIEPLRKLGDLHFTTLTLKNVKADQLNQTVDKMIKDIANIVRVLREKRKINISGIRKIEITYNHKNDDYHPHIHIMHNINIGDTIIDEWLKRNPTSKKQGWDCRKKRMVDLQNTKPVTKESKDDKKYLNEIFKYASKFVVKDNNEKGLLNVYVPALNTILISLHKKRSVQCFGEIRKIKVDDSIEDEIPELISQEIADIEFSERKEWNWAEIDGIYDWLDNCGIRLTHYEPPDIKFIYYL